MAQDLTFVLKARNEAAKATKRFRDDLKAAGTSTDKLRKDADAARRATDKLADEAKRAGDNFGKARTQASGVSKALSGLGRVLAGAAAGFVSFQALSGAVSSALEFNRALAETATLIEGTPEQLRRVTEEASEFTKQFGGNATQQVEAFYQAISAGATDLADATDQVRVANQLAKAGVTDVATAVDIISTAVNSYGASTLSAAEASDSLFTAVRLGKTTVPQLASALGRVVPIAKAAGVSFDELNATVATLTSLGVSTNEAVTGVRGILAAIIKPTSEASDAAQRLGIEFSSAGIAAAGGFIPFLEDVIEKTGGADAELAQLFTGVEGLTPVLALAGGGIQTLGDNLDAFNQKAGATTTALEKVEAQISDRFDRSVASLREDLRKLGDVLLQVVVPAVEAAAAAVSFLADNFALVATAVVALSAGPLLRIGSSFLGIVTALAGPGGLNAAIVAVTASSRLLALALNRIPIIAAAALFVKAVSTANAATEAYARFEAATSDVADTLDRFNTSFARFQGNATPENTQAFLTSAEATVGALEKAVEAAQARLQAALSLQSAFALFDSSETKAARDALEALSTALIDAQARADFAQQAQNRLNAEQKLAAILAEEYAIKTRDVTEITARQVPLFTDLAAEYGTLADVVRDNIRVQNELAEINQQAKLGVVLAEAQELSKITGLLTDEAGGFEQVLLRISQADTFEQQARATQEVVNRIVEAVGGTENLTDAQRLFVEKLLEAVGLATDFAAVDMASGVDAAARAAERVTANLQAALGVAQSLQNSTRSLGIERVGLEAETAALQSGETRNVASARGRIAQNEAEFAERTASIRGNVDPVIYQALTQELERNNAAILENARAQDQAAAAAQRLSSSSGGSAAATSNLSQTVEQLTSKWREAAETAGLTAREVENYQIRQQLLNAAQRDGVALNEEVVAAVLAQRDAYEQAAQAADTFANGARRGYEDFVDSLQTNSEFAQDIVGRTIRGFTSAFQEFFRTGKFGWRDLLADILGQIASFLANRLVIDFLGVAGGGTGGKGTLDFLGSLFGGFRADGGPVTAGTPYVIGERGPEVFVPRTTGTVYPNESLSDFGQTAAPRNINVTMNIVTQDANSFRRSQGQIEARMYQALAIADERNN